VSRALRTLIILLVLPLAGCDWQTFKSSVAGSCAVFERPPYAVLGKTSYDQGVADNFVESGVAGCNWQRPAARPASLDAAVRQKAPALKKKRGLIKRIKERVWPRAAAPVVVVPEPPVVAPIAAEPAPPAAPPPPPPPRSAVDELLSPNDMVRRAFP
jgi:hypothetical protein